MITTLDPTFPKHPVYAERSLESSKQTHIQTSPHSSRATSIQKSRIRGSCEKRVSATDWASSSWPTFPNSSVVRCTRNHSGAQLTLALTQNGLATPEVWSLWTNSQLRSWPASWSVSTPSSDPFGSRQDQRFPLFLAGGLIKRRLQEPFHNGYWNVKTWP